MTHDCPECGETFDTQPGLNSHRGHNHDSHVDVECHHCGEPDRVKPSRADLSERYFCSQDCYGAHLSETGEVRGENNARWKGGTATVNCVNCNAEIGVKRYRTEGQQWFFCTRNCEIEFKTGRYAADKNPNWKGGYDPYYGPNWREQRQRALDRDNHTCQSCGLHADDHHRDLSIHHITPFREFRDDDGIDHENANALDNLLTLCDACHRRWEGIPLRPQAAAD